jgi:hypothetical protein
MPEIIQAVAERKEIRVNPRISGKVADLDQVFFVLELAGADQDR